MKPHNPRPHARDDLAQARADAREFSRWLDQLRSHDPRFAEASAVHPDDHTEWQSAVYLITGNHEIWTSLGPHILADVSIAPIVLELERPTAAGPPPSGCSWTGPRTSGTSATAKSSTPTPSTTTTSAAGSPPATSESASDHDRPLGDPL